MSGAADRRAEQARKPMSRQAKRHQQSAAQPIGGPNRPASR